MLIMILRQLRCCCNFLDGYFIAVTASPSGRHPPPQRSGTKSTGTILDFQIVWTLFFCGSGDKLVWTWDLFVLFVSYGWLGSILGKNLGEFPYFFSKQNYGEKK